MISIPLPIRSVSASLLAAGILCWASTPTVKGGERFLTNLALLDRLTQDAIGQLLDSLEVRPDESLVVLPSGYHEGNDFVADAFARALVRKGCTVRLLPEPGTAPAEEPEAIPLPEIPAAPGEEPETPLAGLLQRDPLAPDSSEAASDSLLWGGLADTIGTADSTSILATGSDGTPGSAETQVPGEAAPAAPAAPAPVIRTYPEGPVLEFRILEFGVSYPLMKRRFVFFGNATVHRLGGVYIRASRIRGPKGEVLGVASGQSHRQDALSGRSRTLAEGATYPFQRPTIPPGRLGKLVEPVVVVGIIGSLVYLFYQNQN